MSFNPKNIVVRFFGYNNEEEVAERDLMDSLGQKAIKEQMEMAEEDLEEEEEEEGAGDDYRYGMVMTDENFMADINLNSLQKG